MLREKVPQEKEINIFKQTRNQERVIKIDEFVTGISLCFSILKKIFYYTTPLD